MNIPNYKFKLLLEELQELIAKGNNATIFELEEFLESVAQTAIDYSPDRYDEGYDVGYEDGKEEAEFEVDRQIQEAYDKGVEDAEVDAEELEAKIRAEYVQALDSL